MTTGNPILWMSRDGKYHRYQWQALLQNWKVTRAEKKHNDAADREVARRLKYGD